jgi:drug/metabolite transporter (DMT)-like permease
MPASVRIAVVTMSLLAGLLLLNALLTWVSRATVAKAIVTSGNSHLSLAAAERFVVLWLLLPYLLLGLLLALSTWYLPKRRAWARWTGLVGSALLVLLTLFSVVASRGITTGSLLVLVVSLGALFGLLAGGTARWVPKLRVRR